MKTQPKTRKVAVYSDGSRHTITRIGNMWHWGRGNVSSHLHGVKHRLAVEYAGHVEIEPNQQYRERLEYTRIIQKLLG